MCQILIPHAVRTVSLPFDEGHRQVAPLAWLPPLHRRVIATFLAYFGPITPCARGGSHAHCPHPPVSFPRSRCAEPWMGLSLRDGYFARRLLGSINWCRAPATPKPGPSQYRPLATSRPVSIFIRGKRPSPVPPAAEAGFLARSEKIRTGERISHF